MFVGSGYLNITVEEFLRLRGGVLGSLVCTLCRDAVALLMVEIDNIQNTKMVRQR